MIVDAVPTDIELVETSSHECVTVIVNRSEHVVATFVSLERIRRAHDQVAYKPAVRAQDGCVFDSTSRFMNAFVAIGFMR